LHELFSKVIPRSLDRSLIDKGQPYLAVDEATNGRHALNKVKETLNKT